MSLPTFPQVATHTAAVANVVLHGGVLSGTIIWGYGATPTAGALTVSDGTTTLINVAGVAVAGFWNTKFNYAAQADPRSTATFSVTLTFTVADGGSAIVGSLNFIQD